MKQSFVKLISKLLRDTADKIDAGTCEINEDQAMDVINMLSHEVMSKEQACIYLNMSRSKFDQYVREGKLPKGRKRIGFTEKYFYKDELVVKE